MASNCVDLISAMRCLNAIYKEIVFRHPTVYEPEMYDLFKQAERVMDEPAKLASICGCIVPTVVMPPAVNSKMILVKNEEYNNLLNEADCTPIVASSVNTVTRRLVVSHIPSFVEANGRWSLLNLSYAQGAPDDGAFPNNRMMNWMLILTIDRTTNEITYSDTHYYGGYGDNGYLQDNDNVAFFNPFNTITPIGTEPIVTAYGSTNPNMAKEVSMLIAWNRPTKTTGITVNKYHMYFNGFTSTSNRKLMFATSPDLSNWTYANSGNPITYPTASWCNSETATINGDPMPNGPIYDLGGSGFFVPVSGQHDIGGSAVRSIGYWICDYDGTILSISTEPLIPATLANEMFIYPTMMYYGGLFHMFVFNRVGSTNYNSYMIKEYVSKSYNKDYVFKRNILRKIDYTNNTGSIYSGTCDAVGGGLFDGKPKLFIGGEARWNFSGTRADRAVGLWHYDAINDEWYEDVRNPIIDNITPVYGNEFGWSNHHTGGEICLITNGTDTYYLATNKGEHYISGSGTKDGTRYHIFAAKLNL